MRPAGSAMVITDVFPPTNVVGIHRTLALCVRLADSGWHVTVITPRTEAGGLRDPGLTAKVPSQVRVVRTPYVNLLSLATRVLRRRPRRPASAGPNTGQAPAASARPKRPGSLSRLVDWLSWWLHIPDGGSGWWFSAVPAGVREGTRHRPDVIFSTAPAWTSHIVGATLSRLLRVPLVADFRDPWCGSAWHRVPYAPHRWVDEHCERFVVRRAARITCAWDGIRRHMASRYPARAMDMQTILNGFDPDEIDATAPVRLVPDRCVLLHAGTFYGPRSPIPLLAGLRRLLDTSPADAARLQLVLMGLSSYNGRPLAELAEAHGVAACIRLMSPVSHRESLAILKGADVAILCGQSGKEALASVPAKAYEYLGAGNPFWPSARGRKSAASWPAAAVGSGAPAARTLARWQMPSEASPPLTGGANSTARSPPRPGWPSPDRGWPRAWSPCCERSPRAASGRRPRRGRHDAERAMDLPDSAVCPRPLGVDLRRPSGRY